MNISEYFDKYRGKKLLFLLSSIGCPEQYDVFDSDNNQVGYVRLRWGHLTVECPDSGGECVYEHSFSDGWKGSFDPEERDYYLNKIENAILNHSTDEEEEMDVERLIDIMENELECITNPCCDRNCGCCHLSMEQSELEAAYRQVIEILKSGK